MKSSKTIGILLGFSEQFRKVYTAEFYSEVAKKELEGQNDSLDVFYLGHALGTFP